MYLTPLVWMISTSLKPEAQATDGSLRLLPVPASSVVERARANYYGEEAAGGAWKPGVWTDPSVDFPRFMRNTLVVCALSVTGMVISSAVVAYGFSRVRWRGRGLVFGVMLATMMIPFAVLMGPLYVIFGRLGLIGTLAPLWLPAWFGGAFNIFLLRQFYMQVPRELDEAARMDGCGHWGTFWRVIVPMSRPALAVVALYHFMFVWNDFLAPMVFLTHRDDFTLALGLQMYQSKAGNTPWNLLMAASTLVVAPVLLLFVLAQRQLVSGLSAGSVKE
ncbi:MAG: carbohydrate ABC transporter permease [Phycisphaeraceae bacterium]|nr:MAG: carbohydrate ABC transporter permease [Phycisphaeraceae bacterium]